jgi:hypothetical protein
MFEAEFTEGDRCTFEVLLDRFGLDDAAFREAIGGSSLNITISKDAEFGRAEGRNQAPHRRDRPDTEGR